MRGRFFYIKSKFTKRDFYSVAAYIENKKMQLISTENTIEDLVKFVHFYVRENKEKYKIPFDRIPDYLPRELKVIYHEFGNFPSHRQPAAAMPTLPLNDDDTSQLFHNQDSLVYFQHLKEEGNRVVFAWENQGVWEVETETYNDDPPVYSDAHLNWSDEIDERKIKICERLSHFLATFCLHELVFGSKNLYSIVDDYNRDDFDRLMEKSKSVWLDGIYVWRDNRLSFYLTEDDILMLVSDGKLSWVGSNEEHDNIADDKILADMLGVEI